METKRPADRSRAAAGRAAAHRAPAANRAQRTAKPAQKAVPKREQPAYDPDELRKALITLTCAAPAADAEAGPALSALTAMAKKKAAREEILIKVGDRTLLTRYLTAEGFKVRKNAARLLGALGAEETLPALTAALKNETVLMAVPSMLLAVGSFSSRAAKDALFAYTLPEAKDETEQKNVLEIKDALKTARSGFESNVPFPVFERFPVPTTVLLTAPEGMNGVLYDELTGLGLHPALAAEGCTLTAERLAPVFRARCFSEMLVPVAAPLSEEPETIAKAFAPAPELPYRIELKNYPGDRAAFIKKTAAALGGTNDPSHYAVELRVDFAETGLRLYRKPVNFTDPRYAWRKASISASIRPETAACLIRFARANASHPAENAHVLDPFCGCGTFLFEREALGGFASLTGVDIKQETIRIAMDNSYAGRSGARFVQKDCLRFVPREPVDELYANLPFGNRVGSHENNEILYRGFVEKLPDLLSDTGFALLYTMETRLLEKCLRREPRLTVRARTATEAGGLLPHAILVEKSR